MAKAAARKANKRRKTAAGGAVRGLRALAAAHGVSEPAAHKWVHDERWAAAGFSVGGPWTPEEIARQKLWRARELRADEAAGGGGVAEANSANMQQIKRLLGVAKIQNTRLANQLMEMRLAIQKGEYRLRAEMEAQESEKWRAVRAALAQLPRALRQILSDAGDAAEVERVLDESLRRVCEEGFHGGAA